MSIYTPQEGAFFDRMLQINVALAFLPPILSATMNWYLDLGLHPDVYMIIWILAELWAFPITFYILYHLVTLPTWLTFGYPVAFGGVRPNICNTTLVPGFFGSGDWPCFPSDLKTRLAEIATGGWRYLFQLDGQLIGCFFFLALNVGFMAMLGAELRKPRFDSETAKQARETCKSCGHRKTVDTEALRHGDCEKHNFKCRMD
jgi:hypothetical protein